MAQGLLELSRAQSLGFRREVNCLEERLAAGAKSLRLAAWAGLQDSVPRSALLSIYARVKGTTFASWEDPSLVQLWGPRFNDYVVAKADLAIFSLGRMPVGERGRARAVRTANGLERVLKGRKMPFGEAAWGMHVPANSLRYAAQTGRVLLRWEGARQPVVWTVDGPAVDAGEARVELARRYLHIFGPGTMAGFGQWAGVGGAEIQKAFAGLGSEVKRRESLWTTRVWPGALVVKGEIAGLWRRSAGEVRVQMWRRLTAGEREAVEAEAKGLPLADAHGPMKVHLI